MIRITESPAIKCTAENIAAFEVAIGGRLPRDYSAFLMETNGGYCGGSPDGMRSVFHYTVGPRKRPEYADLSVMYSLGLGDIEGTSFGDLFEENEKCKRCDYPMPDGLVAIGHTFGYWTILLGISGKYRDGVFIMDEGSGLDWGDVLVANSFTAFNKLTRQEAI